MKMPWEELETDDGLPWSVRGWALFKSGKLGMCENMWEAGQEGKIFRGPRRPEDWPIHPITYDETLEILEVCKKTDATFYEAVVAYFGEDQFPATWLKSMSTTKGVRYDGVPKSNRVGAKAEKRKPGRPRKNKEVAVSAEE